jgi:chromosome segregation ATPase
VVPLYNVELKALKAAIVDVGPRIKERTAFHRQHLSDELAKATTDERQTRLQKLRADLESATRRHQKLSDEFLKVDEAATQDEKAVAGLQQQRDSLAGMKRDAAAAESALAQMDRELDQLRSARQSGKTPAVTYAAMPAILPPTFNLEDSRKAIALGAGASILFIAGIWIRSRSRDSSVTS